MFGEFFFKLILKLCKLRQFLISGEISFQCLDPVNKIDRWQINFLTEGERMSSDRLRDLQCTEEFQLKEPLKQFGSLL